MNNIHKYMHVPIRPQSNFYLLAVFITLLVYSCGGTKGTTVKGPQLINANIDLVNVNNDRVKVIVAPNIQINSDTLSYVMAKIIPGTYAIHDYGKYLDDFQAFDKQNNLLTATKTTTNTWLISNAKNLAYISYLVNDTFDTEVGFNPFDENSETIFSPAGTNILAGKN
ncbi:M61 family metallopeptidase, partial [Aegicerativicinus sediminis]